MQPLTGGPRSEFTEAEVLDVLSLRSIPVYTWGVDILTTGGLDTGEDLDVLDGSGEVTWSYTVPKSWAGAATEMASVRRMASVTLSDKADPSTLLGVLLRVWVALNDVKWYMGVFTPSLPTTSDDGSLVTHALSLADKTFLLSQRNVVSPVTIIAGTDPVAWITADMWSRFGEHLFSTSTPQRLVRPYTSGGDSSTSYLDLYNALLAQVGFDQIISTEEGLLQTKPLADIVGQGSSVTYGPGDLVQVPGQITPLLPNIPNQLTFTARTPDTAPVVLINQSTGPASIDTRGGVVVEQTIASDADTAEALADFAAGTAIKVFAGGGRTFTGSVGLNPGFSDRDRITLNRPRLDMSGLWDITAWSFPLGGTDTTMTLTAEQMVAKPTLGPNLIPDPGFEAPIAGTGWESNNAYGQYTVATLDRDITMAKTGAASLRVSWPSGPQSWANNHSDQLIIGTTYQMDADVWVDSGSPDVGLTSVFYWTGETTSVKDQWVHLTGRFVSTVTLAYLGVETRTAPTSGQGMWLDNFSVKEVLA